MDMSCFIDKFQFSRTVNLEPLNDKYLPDLGVNRNLIFLWESFW